MMLPGGNLLTTGLMLLRHEVGCGWNGTAGQGEGLPPLTREQASKVALDGLVFVTLADADLLDFALNWAEHLEEWGVMNFLVGGAPLCLCACS